MIVFTGGGTSSLGGGGTFLSIGGGGARSVYLTFFNETSSTSTSDSKNLLIVGNARIKAATRIVIADASTTFFEYIFRIKYAPYALFLFSKTMSTHEVLSTSCVFIAWNLL
jgi:hypothetical protein